MLLSFVLAAQAAIQTATSVDAADPTAHLRYKRAVQMPSLPAGESSVCAVLDAAAFAHAASPSGDDLRLYREPGSSSALAVETPFTLLESESAPEDAVAADVQNVAAHGDTLSFDLAMPHRAYTMVRLHLAASDFLAEATVTAAAAPGTPATKLGKYTLFDLAGEHLARSTELPLQEAHLPRLHVELRLWRTDGTPIAHPRTDIVQGAEVPPSREAQTLYTTVAATSELSAQGQGPHRYRVATLRIPAHVPAERVSFVLDPAFTQSFLRRVRIDASPGEGAAAAESVQGIVARVDRPSPGADAPPVHYASLHMDDTLGANLRAPAVVRVFIPEQDGQTLPLRSIELQMRQRSFCFQAAAGAVYTLRYGDASLPPPVYHSEDKDGTSEDKDGNSEDKDGIGQDKNADATGADALENVAENTHPPARQMLAVLGPEQENPAFIAQPARAAAGERHTGMFWVGLLSIVVLAAALAAHRGRYEREGT